MAEALRRFLKSTTARSFSSTSRLLSPTRSVPWRNRLYSTTNTTHARIDIKMTISDGSDDANDKTKALNLPENIDYGASEMNHFVYINQDGVYAYDVYQVNHAQPPVQRVVTRKLKPIGWLILGVFGVGVGSVIVACVGYVRKLWKKREE